MGTARSNINFCFLAFCASLLLATSCHGSKHVALFIFGDSLYDVGNNKYVKEAPTFASFWPYGETFFKHPTGRSSDGRLIPDFIVEYAKLPLIPPYLQLENRKSIKGMNFVSKVTGVLVGTHQDMVSRKLRGPEIHLYQQPIHHKFINGVNFASAGAGALVETHHGKVIDLQTQLRYFKNVEKQLRRTLGDTEAKKLFSTAVYMISIGGNDYFEVLTPNNGSFLFHSIEDHVNTVIGNITTLIQEIHEKGGRKFGFLNMIPLGCMPFWRAVKQDSTGFSGCLDEAALFAKLHNRVLSTALAKLEKQLEGFRYSIFDGYTAGMERINNPSKYGFKEVQEACYGCGTYRGSLTCGQKGYHLCDYVREYFSFDPVHPTDFTNSQFAKLMWSGNLDIVKPCNLKSLFDN